MTRACTRPRRNRPSARTRPRARTALGGGGQGGQGGGATPGDD